MATDEEHLSRITLSVDKIGTMATPDTHEKYLVHKFKLHIQMMKKLIFLLSKILKWAIKN